MFHLHMHAFVLPSCVQACARILDVQTVTFMTVLFMDQTKVDVIATKTAALQQLLTYARTLCRELNKLGEHHAISNFGPALRPKVKPPLAATMNCQ